MMNLEDAMNKDMYNGINMNGNKHGHGGSINGLVRSSTMVPHLAELPLNSNPEVDSMSWFQSIICFAAYEFAMGKFVPSRFIVPKRALSNRWIKNDKGVWRCHFGSMHFMNVKGAPNKKRGIPEGEGVAHSNSKRIRPTDIQQQQQQYHHQVQQQLQQNPMQQHLQHQSQYHTYQPQTQILPQQQPQQHQQQLLEQARQQRPHPQQPPPTLQPHKHQHQDKNQEQPEILTQDCFDKVISSSKLLQLSRIRRNELMSATVPSSKSTKHDNRNEVRTGPTKTTPKAPSECVPTSSNTLPSDRNAVKANNTATKFVPASVSGVQESSNGSTATPGGYTYSSPNAKFSINSDTRPSNATAFKVTKFLLSKKSKKEKQMSQCNDESESTTFDISGSSAFKSVPSRTGKFAHWERHRCANHVHAAYYAFFMNNSSKFSRGGEDAAIADATLLDPTYRARLTRIRTAYR